MDASWIHLLALIHFFHLNVEKQVFIPQNIFLGGANFLLEVMNHHKIVYDANPFHENLINH